MQAKDNARHGKPNNKQKRKHVTQMSNNEIKFIRKELSRSLHTNKHKLTLSKHLVDKMDKGDTDIDMSVVTRMIHQFKDCLIEYSHMTKGKKGYVTDRRVLLRSKEELTIQMDGRKSKCNLCVVINIDKCEIITTWFNNSYYNHHNLRLHRYDANLNILKAKCYKRVDK